MNNFHIRSILSVIIVFVIVVVLSKIKQKILYTPIKPNNIEKFDKKITNLVGSKDLMIKFEKDLDYKNTIKGYYLKNNNNNKCIIIVPGLFGNLYLRYDLIKFYYNYCSVIIFDYSVYSSTNFMSNITYSSLQNDVYNIWEYVVYKFNYNPNDIILVGEGLSSSLILRLASELSYHANPDKYPMAIVLNFPKFSSLSIIENKLSSMNLFQLSKYYKYTMKEEYNSFKYIRLMSREMKFIIGYTKEDTMFYSKAYGLIKPFKNNNIIYTEIEGSDNDMNITEEYIYVIAKLFD